MRGRSAVLPEVSQEVSERCARERARDWESTIRHAEEDRASCPLRPNTGNLRYMCSILHVYMAPSDVSHATFIDTDVSLRPQPGLAHLTSTDLTWPCTISRWLTSYNPG